MSSSVQSGTPITNDLFSQALQHALQASGQPSLQVSLPPSDVHTASLVLWTLGFSLLCGGPSAWPALLQEQLGRDSVTAEGARSKGGIVPAASTPAPSAHGLAPLTAGLGTCGSFNGGVTHLRNGVFPAISVHNIVTVISNCRAPS